MSDETEGNVNESSVEDKSNLIGVDPLAWLSEEEKVSVLKENESTQDNDEINVDKTSTYSIKLNSSITIRDIAGLMGELNNISPDKTELIFESEKVERVDAAALQLLTGFYLFSVESGKKVIWNKPSDALCHAAELLGLKDIIQLPSVAA